MQELSMSIQDSFGLYLNKTTSELISGITGGIYTSISIDENLNAFLNTKKKLVPLEQVSGGTADQIYLALRLTPPSLSRAGKTGCLSSLTTASYSMMTTGAHGADMAFQSLPGTDYCIYLRHKREGRILKEAGVDYNLIEI